ncbi:DUF4328 domain-containing protein [Kitasatospora sp. NPDC101183]|uniref:DUF4328 domain-containing protein n=1 Tax=Kitasatospora sp. NPDC101183 TaxID=3364100 RepID=UPI0038216000
MSSPAVYRSPRTTATVATVLLAVTMAVSVLAVVADLLLFGSADEISPNSLTTADWMVALSGLLQVLALIATAAAFITWFHRVRVNAEVFDPMGHRRTRGWAIGAWFTPVVCLWFPREIAVDIWQAGARRDASGARVPQPLGVLNTWWITFWLANATGRIGGNIFDSAAYADSYRTAALWLLASDVLDLVAAAFAIAVVQKLSATQEERFAELAAAHPYGPGFPGTPGFPYAPAAPGFPGAPSAPAAPGAPAGS